MKADMEERKNKTRKENSARNIRNEGEYISIE
jgi:hypothetical protein